MILIPCTTGTVALYAQEDGSTLAVLVEAWDDQGAPYVAGPGGLAAATNLQAGFLRLERATAIVPAPALPPTVVRAVPRQRGGPRLERGQA